MDLLRLPIRFRNPRFRFYCSYLFDWVLCIVLLLLFFSLDKAEPFHRDFSVQDTAIMFPYKSKETIPVWALGLIAVFFPVVTILVVGLGIRRSRHDFHNGILGLLVSLMLANVFTQALKVTVGKPRPDFLSRCQPMMNGTLITHDEPLKLWTHDVCSQTDAAILKDGYLAFPSGHSSNAFAGLFYISLWLAGKMHVFDRGGYSLKGVIFIIPILTALLIAISRVEDYRHAPIDVTWGAILGIVSAIFAYHQYYPSLTSTLSQIPHPPRDFRYLEKDLQGQVEELGQVEQDTSIQLNDNIVESIQLEENANIHSSSSRLMRKGVAPHIV
ncbi:hypothetical protein BGZ58_006611 [Dissophora ornata]|nr:hypothetical protein BGZ58_006611 [Dissophora ornata]